MEIKIIDDDKNTNLHHLVAKGDLDALNSFGTSQKIDIENAYGWTPLMLAVSYGHVDIVRLLIDKNADATRKNKFGGSVFLMAVANGNLEVLSIILKHLLCGGVSKSSMESVMSPLSFAILFNHECVFKYLLENNFSAKIIDRELSLTPLMFAGLNENKTFTMMLLTNGADRLLRNCYGENVDDIFVKYTSSVGKTDSSSHQQQPSNAEPTTPSVYITSPQPSFFYENRIRKSSNVHPNFYYSPKLTPIPVFYPQVFFPVDFNPSAIYQQQAMPISPVPFQMDYNSPLNQHVIGQDGIVSPAFVYPVLHGQF